MKIRKEDGYTLVTVLLVILLLTILGGAYILAMNFEVRQSFSHDNRIQAYYMGRSGVEAASQWLIKNQNDILRIDSEGNLNYTDTFLGKFDENNSYTLEFSGNFSGIKENNSSKEIDGKISFLKNGSQVEGITIEALGNFRGAKQTVKLDMNLADGFFDKAVYSYSDIYADQSPMETVRIYGGAESAGNIVYNPGQIAPPEGTDPADEEEYIIPYSYREFPEPIFPSPTVTQDDIVVMPNNERTITPDAAWFYTKLDIRSNADFYVEATEVTEIVVDEIVGEGTFHTKCIEEDCPCQPDPDDPEDQGDPTLCNSMVYLYVNDFAEIKTPGGGNTVPIMVFLKEGAEFNIQAGSEFNGFVYGPGATVYLQSNVTFNGAMIVGDLRRTEEQSSFIGVVDNTKYNLKLDPDYFSQIVQKVFRGIWK